MQPSPILGAILAGGRSSRFGSDKALALMPDGRTLLDYAIAALAPHVAQVVICGRPGGLADRPQPDLGPLGGLNAALHHARANGFAGVLSSGCDMPIYPTDLPTLLLGEDPAFVAGQPLIGWWPSALADQLDAHLAEPNSRSIRGWTEQIGARAIVADGLDLPNINRPDDLTRWGLSSP